MESFTFGRGHGFPAGTTVSAYEDVGQRHEGAPNGVPVADTGLVDSAGNLTIDALEAGKRYWAYAVVAGAHRWTGFRVDDPQALPDGSAHLRGADLLPLDARIDALESGLGPAAGGGDTASLQAMISALAEGDVLTLRRGANYVIDAPLSVLTDRVSIILNGATITQTVVNKPVFDVFDADDVVIDATGGWMYNSAARLWVATSFRGDATYIYSAAIWSNGERGRFAGIKAYGFTSAVMLSNWNGVDFTAQPKYGNVVEITDVSECEFGVLAWGQDSPKIDVRGTVTPSPSSPNPEHLVYFTPNAASRTPEIKANGFDIGAGASCVQLKSIVGGTADITIRNCARALNLFGTDDMEITVNGTSQGDGENGVIFWGDALSDRNRIEATIEMTAAGRGARIDGNDNVVNLTLISNRSAQTGNENVQVAGNRNAVVCKQENAGSTTTGGDGILVVGDNCVIRDPEMRGVRNGIQISAAADGTVIEGNGDLIQPETGFNVVGDSGTNTKCYLRLQGSKTWDPASVADGAMTSTTVTVTGAKVGNAVAVGFSLAVPAGALLTGQVTADNTVTVTLFNKTGGALDLASGTLRAQVFRY